MKAIAWLLIVASLVAAIVASVTAYLPRLSLPDERLVGLTLNAPAGKDRQTAKPLATAGTVLTPELLTTLRESGVNRVKVKEFSIRRWNEAWLFLLGAIGMLSGAFIVRRETARHLAVVHADAGTGAGPDEVLTKIHNQVEALRDRLGRTGATEEGRYLINESLGQIIAIQIPAFIAARPALVARLGLGGYAQLMDRFAAAERQINRAWSAAADGYGEEALDCVNRSAVLLQEAEQRLRPHAETAP